MKWYAEADYAEKNEIDSYVNQEGMPCSSIAIVPRMQTRTRTTRKPSRPRPDASFRVFVTNEVTWDAATILGYYALRWTIETSYRDLSQDLNLHGCVFRFFSQGAIPSWVAGLVSWLSREHPPCWLRCLGHRH